MIRLTRLDGSELYVNAEFIQSVESKPDTHIVLFNGHSYVVTESDHDVVQQIIDYRRGAARKLRSGGVEWSGHQDAVWCSEQQVPARGVDRGASGCEKAALPRVEVYCPDLRPFVGKGAQNLENPHRAAGENSERPVGDCPCRQFRQDLGCLAPSTCGWNACQYKGRGLSDVYIPVGGPVPHDIGLAQRSTRTSDEWNHAQRGTGHDERHLLLVG